MFFLRHLNVNSFFCFPFDFEGWSGRASFTLHPWSQGAFSLSFFSPVSCPPVGTADPWVLGTGPGQLWSCRDWRWWRRLTWHYAVVLLLVRWSSGKSVGFARPQKNIFREIEKNVIQQLRMQLLKADIPVFDSWLTPCGCVALGRFLSSSKHLFHVLENDSTCRSDWRPWDDACLLLSTAPRTLLNTH